GAPDGKLTDLFFLTCSMDDRYHLHVLARLCRMLQDNTFIDDLRHAQTNEEIIELMTKCEQSVLEA
ncbi:MAG: PTS sugar transporter subunit IIA, partial [Desulfobulbaceae bacterium]|nr:PTS sugar transporter subunit IIA [Desulfobulbaceae bacterium]